MPRIHCARLLAAAALAAAALAASAGDDKGLQEKLDRQRYQRGAAVEAIHNYELDGWNYVDKTHIIIHTGPSRDYLISLMAPCDDLATAENIAFTTTASQLTRFDKLMVRGAGGIVRQCPITQIDALTKKAAP